MALSPDVPVVVPLELITSQHLNNIRANLDRLDTTKLSTAGGTMTGQLVGTSVILSAQTSIVADGHVAIGTTIGGVDDGLELRSNGLAWSRSATAGLANLFLDRIATAAADNEPFAQFRINQIPQILGAIRRQGTGVVYQTTSDGRYKVVDAELDADDAADTVRAMRPVSFRWRDITDGWDETADAVGDPEVGFIAQDMQPLTPESVWTPPADDPSQPWGMDYGRITPYLVGALKAALDRIDALTARVAELEGAP